MSRVYLSLGSNLEPEKNLRDALRELRERFGALSVSSVYRSKAAGFDGPDFWNLAVGFDSELDADSLQAWLHEMENRHDRRRDVPRYSDRTLDADIVAIDERATARPELQHAFVLAPLADIAPQVRAAASDKTIGELWARFSETNPGEARSLQWLNVELEDNF
ncbi:MAG: 2-amino-4-hydroxy-6-hydroxymethyldihydropteridine diphosphokinase [Rhodanobacteraceae bacterium]